MTTRERVLIAVLGITGIVAAGAIALTANAISGREIGLSAQPVSLGRETAPPRPARAMEDRGDDRGGSVAADDDVSHGDTSSGPGSDDEGPSSSSGPGGGDDSGSGSSGTGGSSSGSGSGSSIGGDDHGGGSGSGGGSDDGAGHD